MVAYTPSSSSGPAPDQTTITVDPDAATAGSCCRPAVDDPLTSTWSGSVAWPVYRRKIPSLSESGPAGEAWSCAVTTGGSMGTSMGSGGGSIGDTTGGVSGGSTGAGGDTGAGGARNSSPSPSKTTAKRSSPTAATAGSDWSPAVWRLSTSSPRSAVPVGSNRRVKTS